MKHFTLLRHTQSVKRQPAYFLGYYLLLVVFFTVNVIYAPNTSAQSYDVTATVAPPPPMAPGVITSPVNFQHFTSATITVQGTCPLDASYVTILRNGFSVATTTCNNGVFNAGITLVSDINNLQVSVFNSGGDGPMSIPVLVYYDVLPLIPESILPIFGITNEPEQSQPPLPGATRPVAQPSPPLLSISSKPPVDILKDYVQPASVAFFVTATAVSILHIRRVRLRALKNALIDRNKDSK
jgi:hypothetical protein